MSPLRSSTLGAHIRTNWLSSTPPSKSAPVLACTVDPVHTTEFLKHGMVPRLKRPTCHLDPSLRIEPPLSNLVSRSRSWIDCGVASPDSGTTNLRVGRRTTNGASSSEESIRVKCPGSEPSLRTLLRLRRYGPAPGTPCGKTETVSSPDNSANLL